MHRISELVGERRILQGQRVSAISLYDATNARISIAEAAKPHFKELRSKIEHSAVGLYSDLLTGIVHDVMGFKDQSIELSTDVVRSKTVLNIDTVKNGKRESIDTGRGGSIANLVAAGLRCISLIKSSNRRFLVVDECECWLEPHLIPKFVSVIERLCDKIGVQAIMISHHASDLVSSERSKVISITPGHLGILQAVNSEKNYVVGHEFGENPDELYSELSSSIEHGISAIHLVNFQSHVHTALNLSKSLTVINGANDIGKSSIARALKGILENNFTDDFVNHNADTASVSLTVEDDCVVQWTFRRGCKVALYTFTRGNTVLQEGEFERGDIPVWLDDVLCMPLVNGINIHIADQKDPLFLLNPSISSAERAEMLNLGTAFHKLQSIMAINADLLRQDRAQLKSLMGQINDLNDKLFFLGPIEELLTAKNLTEELQESELGEVEAIIQIIQKTEAVLNHGQVLDLIGDLPTPDLEDEHQDLAFTLTQTNDFNRYPELMGQIESILSSITLFDLKDTSESALFDLVRHQNTSDNTVAIELLCSIGDMAVQLDLYDAGINLDDYLRLIEVHASLELELEEAEDAIEVLERQILEIPQCPECGQQIGIHLLHNSAVNIDYMPITSLTPAPAYKTAKTSKNVLMLSGVLS